MARLRAKILQQSNKFHSILGWLGGAAIILFGLSGLLHPIMSWTTPQAVQFMPPALQIASEDVGHIADILKTQKITSAETIKITPSNDGAMVQITSDSQKPRLYVNLHTKQVLDIQQDHDHAIWLARYYTGLKETPIKTITLQTEFDDAYPWVNRLLPVYKITFDRPDALTAYIHTGTNALASLGNNRKTQLQKFFGLIHTWAFMHNEPVRLIGMNALLLPLIGLGVTGCLMIFMIKKRKINDGWRRYHRRFSILIWLPLLVLSISGTYHLIYSALSYNPTAAAPIPLIQNFTLAPERLVKNPKNLIAQAHHINAISLLNTAEGIMYRLSHSMAAMPKSEHDHSKEAKFKGIPTHQGAVYINAYNDDISTMNDEKLARFYARNWLKPQHKDVRDTKIITHFTPDYDFRHKALPVWQVDYVDQHHQFAGRLFVDPATGKIQEALTRPQMIERYSFSFLHKWNMLIPLIGRFWRDIVLCVVLGLSVAASITGYVMLIRKQMRKK